MELYMSNEQNIEALQRVQTLTIETVESWLSRKKQETEEIIGEDGTLVQVPTGRLVPDVGPTELALALKLLQQNNIKSEVQQQNRMNSLKEKLAKKRTLPSLDHD